MRSALVVLSIFAAAWAVLALQLAGAAPGFAALPILLSLALVGWGWRSTGAAPARGPRVGRLIALWTTIEFVALVVAANLLAISHHPELIFPVAALIVGLHFFPLARGIPVPLYHATGAGLVAAAVLGLLVPVAERAPVVGLAAALVLWGTALAIARRARAALAGA